ncbi:AsmA-like C-terminal region-containing protein [uncultured Flavobacterium sp.]|uniref:AsmA-like C-terminal region-containing protein n=1 Tax=uncultured Flavobacterium sp. TaxID=165435 RepID=UPI0030EC5710
MAVERKLFLKALKFTGILIVSILGILIIVPIIFADTITEKVKLFANENLEGELNFKDSNLSFFNHFPSLTLTLEEFSLNGSAPFEKQSLITAKEIGFGIDIPSMLFGSEAQIDKVFINNAKINVQVNKKGEANYNIYKSSETAVTNDSSASLNLKNIQIVNSELIYNDASTKILIEAKGFNYIGKGNLLDVNFSLTTSASIADFNFTYDKNQYLKNKAVKANLITKINTNSLAFVFEKNDLIINKLPVEFKGFFNFLSNGYDMDFNLKTENSNLEDLFTALPAEYISWKSQTIMKGTTSASFSLKGKYIAAKNINPEVRFKINVRDGYVKNGKAAFPVENIYLNLDTKLPNLDMNQLSIQLDSLYFDINKSKLSAILKSDGFGKKIKIDTKIKSKIDLKTLSDALQIPDIELTGNLDTDIISKGIYDVEEKKFPITKGYFNLNNGSIKTTYYSKPIEKISFKADLNCPTSDFKDANLKILLATFTCENENFTLNASFKDFSDLNYNVQAKGIINLTAIYKVFAQKGLDLNGIIKADVSLIGKQSDASNGKYQNLKNSGTLDLTNIQTTSDFLPKPFLIEKGLFTFNQEKMNFSNFRGKYGASDITMNGYVLNVINFYLSDKETLKGNFTLHSNYLNINEFMPTETTKSEENPTSTSVSGVIEIPANLDVIIKTLAKKVTYDDLAIENLGGIIQIQNGVASLKNGTLGIIGATANINGTYKNEGTEKAYFDYNIKANDFDVKRAYNEIKLFKEIVSAAENAEGIVSLDYAIKGVLNNQMEPVAPSLEGKGTLSVKQVKMKGFKLLNTVALRTENPDIKDPDITKVDIKSTIKNNLLTIERFKFKVSGFRLRFEGESSLDGKLNLKMRVGLPPLGIIGIPIKVTGNQENPQINIGKKSEDLEETIYEDGVTPINAPVQNDSIPKPIVPIEKVE